MEVFAEMKRLTTLLLCLLLLAACGPDTKTKTVDLKQSFGTYTGTFKLHDLAKGTYTVYNPDPEGQRYAPASTFKVLHSLIALQTGVVPDAQATRRWDGTVYPIPAWNKDQTLSSAVKDSVIWYFQDLAREIGRDR
jgi:beta-lactamase class D